MLSLCFSAFVCFGLVLVLVGANQAEIARELELDLMQSGMLGSALALGIGIGVVSAGPLFDRWARRSLFVGSAFVAGVALLSVGPGVGFDALLLHVVAIGLGIGIYDTFINAMIVERFRGDSARPMTIVHAGATVGAMLGPLLIGAMTSQLHWTTSFRVAGVAHLGVAVWGAFVAFPPIRTDAGSEPVAPIPLLRSRALIPFAAVAFAYVGVESAMTIFAVPYANGALDLDSGRTAISGLWLGLFAGRMTTAAFARTLGPWLIVGSGAAGGACVLAGVVSASTHVVEIFAVMGFSLGCVYPVMIAGTGKQFPHAPGTAAGLAAGAGALGGFFVPWLTGAIGDMSGIAAGLGSIAAWCAAIAVGGVAMARVPPPPRRGDADLRFD